ncbi:MAG: 4'-phosphopantetheinyl transferase superfamily protein [Bacteroidetes bacterium]|nr:MAG: 4'-phosphopantetheinyl transferase superfamily protein [Bacteroidota bacterium]
MPFVKKISLENGIIGIWEISESAGSLISAFQFSENEKNEFKKFIGEKRQKEYLATRLLLQNILGQKTEVIYLESRRPLLKNSKLNISISHSSDFVTVFISNELCGIDVENVHRNIDRVTKRFLHPEELAWIENSNQSQILKIIYWSAKEAIYKCSCETGIQFDKQIFINPFEIEKTDLFSGKLTCKNRNVHYILRYFILENNVVVYCVEDKKNSL